MVDTMIETFATVRRFTKELPTMLSRARIYPCSPGRLALQIRAKNGRSATVATAELDLTQAMQARDAIDAWIREQGPDAIDAAIETADKAADLPLPCGGAVVATRWTIVGGRSPDSPPMLRDNPRAVARIVAMFQPGELRATALAVAYLLNQSDQEGRDRYAAEQARLQGETL